MKIYGNEQSVYQNNEEPYFSILMPVYNNQSTIVETLDSVINQTFQNFEIIIVNDGSIDDTKTVIKGFEDIRIRYFYQKNEDQLNALIKCISNSRGKVFFVLHGDDCLYNNTTLENAFNSFQEVNVDAIIGNIYLMDSDSRIYSKVKQIGNLNPVHANAYLHLSLGNNIFNDVAFVRREAYLNISKNSYLMWNMPFWVNLLQDEYKENLKLEFRDFGMLRYRYDSKKGGNYINSLDGRSNVMNGVLRTFILNSKNIRIPFFTIQRLFFRVFKGQYRPFYFKTETKNLNNLIRKCIGVYKLDFKHDLFVNSLVGFFRHNSDKSIHLEFEISNEDVFYGKDIREFNKLLRARELPKIYLFLFDSMESGFSAIITPKVNERKLKDILTFLCIVKHVKIELY